jgi:hypothetical protein
LKAGDPTPEYQLVPCQHSQDVAGSAYTENTTDLSHWKREGDMRCHESGDLPDDRITFATSNWQKGTK